MLPPLPPKVDQQQIRHRNLSLVLGLLTHEGPMSRAALAERSELTKATISNLVDVLAAEGLVADAGPAGAGGRGRPATLVDLTDRHVALGLAIDVDHVGVCVTDLRGKVHRLRRRAYDNEGVRPGVALGRLTLLAAVELEALAAGGHRVRDATVAIPGLVDPATGMIVAAPNLGWGETDITAHLAGALGLPVTVANEADLIATAEIGWGRGPDFRDFLLISTGVGVGAGVVIDGQVFRGAHGFGGELGHIVVEPLGRPCPCGNRGCLERYVGRNGLPKALGAAGNDWAETAAAAARGGQRRVLAAIDEVAVHLGRALVTAVHLFDPRAVVLAGDLAPLAPWLLGPLTTELEQHALGRRWARYEVVASTLGTDAALLGAAAVGIDRLLADPLAAD